MLKLKAHDLEKVFLFFLLSLLFYSLFRGFPTDQGEIGLSANILDIGDRPFYINQLNDDYGYSDYKGNLLYPSILIAIKRICLLFSDNDATSFLWNSIVISITSVLSFFILRLLRVASNLIYGELVSFYACLIYILNPYVYFYSLSGGITLYILFNVTFILYIYALLYKYNNKNYKDKFKYYFCILFSCLALSALRPTGGIFSIFVLTTIFIDIFNESIKFNNVRLIKLLSLSFFVIAIIFCIQNLIDVRAYINDNIIAFSNERGTFFGYPRELLRNNLSDIVVDNISFFKSSFLNVLIKCMEFVSGLSDIRDTHAGYKIKAVFPFLARISTGLFYLYPLNLLSFLGIISNYRLIKSSKLWVVLVACFLALSPSFLGYSNSRYLIMFFTPFILFAAKLISDIIALSKNQLNNPYIND
tara:strand:+ start:5556 stop:6806 length:1251 start_codon:yes stop_codon:yes gene_type:complete